MAMYNPPYKVAQDAGEKFNKSAWSRYKYIMGKREKEAHEQIRESMLRLRRRGHKHVWAVAWLEDMRVHVVAGSAQTYGEMITAFIERWFHEWRNQDRVLAAAVTMQGCITRTTAFAVQGDGFDGDPVDPEFEIERYKDGSVVKDRGLWGWGASKKELAE